MKAIVSFDSWFEQRRNEFDAVVFDIDGTLVKGGHSLAGSVELLDRLRAERTPFSLLTNDGSHSRREKCRELAGCGIHVHPLEIVSCSHAFPEVVKSNRLEGRLFYVMGSLGNPCFARAAGLRTTQKLSRAPRSDGVIVGEGDYDWEPAFNAAVNLLVRKPRAPVIVPNPDAYFAARDGSLILAAGAAIGCIRTVLEAYGMQIKPIFLGKPYQPIFLHNHRLLEERLGRRIARNRVLMLGDMLVSDVGGAKTFGYKAGLMLTGATHRRKVAHSPILPDIIFDRL